MKRFFASILSLVAVAFVLASCENIGMADRDGEGGLSFSIAREGLATKAITDAVAYETRVNSLDVFVFEGGTTLYYHGRAVNGTTPSDPNRFTWESSNTNGITSGTVKKLPVTTANSKYTLVMVANLPADKMSGKMTIADIEAVAFNLGNMSRTESEGFVMYAKKANVVVNAGDTPTAVDGGIQLERFASRVRLVSVQNTIPASANYSNSNKVTVNGIFISNVPSVWNVGASGNPSTIVNVAGRKNNTAISPSVAPDYAITGYFPTAVEIAQSASATALGWSAYALPITSVAQGYTSPKFVICAIVNGTQYYYPVELVRAATTTQEARGGIERNKTYDITVSISGTGSLDPDVVVVRGSLSATISVKAWVSGADYAENI